MRPILPGESLFLHTDGVEDARDPQGRFFPRPPRSPRPSGAQPVSPQTVLRAVFTRLLRHTGGRPADDVAVLILRNDRSRVPTQQSCTVARHMG